DVSTLADKDYYSITTPLSVGGVTIQLQTSGISMLNARLTVYNAAGKVVGSATDTDPLSGDLTVRLTSALPLSTYTIKVESATADVFGIGSYHLTVQTLPPMDNQLPTTPASTPTTTTAAL